MGSEVPLDAVASYGRVWVISASVAGITSAPHIGMALTCHSVSPECPGQANESLSGRSERRRQPDLSQTWLGHAPAC